MHGLILIISRVLQASSMKVSISPLYNRVAADDEAAKEDSPTQVLSKHVHALPEEATEGTLIEWGEAVHVQALGPTNSTAAMITHSLSDYKAGRATRKLYKKGAVGDCRRWAQAPDPVAVMLPRPWAQRLLCRRSYYRPSDQRWPRSFEDSWSSRRRHPTWQYIAFAASGSVAAYGMAMIVDAEREKKRRMQWLKTAQNSLRGTWNNQQVGSSWHRLSQWWHGLRESQQTMSLLIASNAVVFLAWQVPRLRPTMNRLFLHSTSSHPLTMLSSVFSHRTPMHLAFNMLALWSFGTILHDRLGREHFLAFYTTAGLGASLGSHLVKLWRRDPASSLGASGALFGVFGACAHIPNVTVSLIFIPFHSFALDKALPAIMAIDAFGLWRGWRSFDHAAHLSGAAAGYLLYPASTRYVWAHRRRILQAVGYPTT